ncbi:GTPase domain-containing protein [Actinotalea sp. AC32]|nr:GTPase domain-containing protein [Actinotalea sp. AC32]
MPADLDLRATGAVPGDGRRPAGAERSWAEATLLDAVQDLRRDVALTRFPLPVDGVEHAERRRRQLLDQLDDHLLPRLRELAAPAVVVVAGSTGAGKSTLVNSIVGTEVSAAGVLRPTTRRPVLVHHPADGDLLTEHPLREIVEVVVREEVPRGIALVDAPDLDSLLASNRSTAHRLLEAADLWVFVTTAARYGDAVPWQVLGEAATRGTSMAMVLNRVPADALVTVRTDLLDRLRSRGMGTVPLFLLPDLGPHQGLLEERSVAPVRRWLAMVAGSDRARSVIRRTQRGALRALRPWVTELARAVQDQVDARVDLQARVEGSLSAPAERAAGAVRAGAVAEGPVRARWSAVAGSGGPLQGRLTGRRGRVEREAALDGLRAELEEAAVVALAAARRMGRNAVLDVLDGSAAPGASAVVRALEDPGTDADALARARSDAAAWVAAVDLAVAGDGATASPAARLVRVLGTSGAATVVAAAAVGLGAARALVTRTIGTGPTEDLVRAVTEDLARRAHEAALGGAAPAQGVLAAPDLADDASARLNLRLAVLKGLT